MKATQNDPVSGMMMEASQSDVGARTKMEATQSDASAGMKMTYLRDIFGNGFHVAKDASMRVVEKFGSTIRARFDSFKSTSAPMFLSGSTDDPIHQGMGGPSSNTTRG